MMLALLFSLSNSELFRIRLRIIATERKPFVFVSYLTKLQMQDIMGLTSGQRTNEKG